MEHLTSLDGVNLVAKTHPRMELRDMLDGLAASVVELQVSAEEKGENMLVARLEEIRTELRHVMAAEVSGTPCRAFEIPEGVEREDIVKTLNRLSSAVYILIYDYIPKNYDKTIVFGSERGKLSE